MLLKNEAVLKKAEASDQWNFYQSKSTKGHLAELAARLTKDPAQVEFYKKEIGRYDLEKKEIRAKAEELDKQSHKVNDDSEHALHPLHKLEQALTLIQIAIALGSITALTRKRWLFVDGHRCGGRRRHPVRHRAGVVGAGDEAMAVRLGWG